MHNYSNMRTKQTVINTCQILPFFKFRGLISANNPFFLISRIRVSHWKNTPFFAKMGTGVVYVLVGSGGPGTAITRHEPGDDPEDENLGSRHHNM